VDPLTTVSGDPFVDFVLLAFKYVDVLIPIGIAFRKLQKGDRLTRSNIFLSFLLWLKITHT
jgi:hypothetical protein